MSLVRLNWEIMTHNLPYSDQLDIGALSGLFRHTTNSYKFLFFLSLLRILEERKFDARKGISLQDLETEMLVTAWYPHSFFRLSFGSQDKVYSILNHIELSGNDRDILSGSGRRNLRQQIERKIGISRFVLLRYVPFRILSPFFAAQIRGMSDARVNRRIVELAQSGFETRKPLFKIDYERDLIILHPDWIAYLQRHCSIVQGWAFWHWAEYMQRRNPNVPALIKKLIPPKRRETLQSQRKFWDLVLSKRKIRCIYTGELISGRYDLDHFLPWRFVVHDELWNLIPVAPEANNAKRDQLPNEKYIDDFVSLQQEALIVARDFLSPQRLKKAIEPYVANLHLGGATALYDRNHLETAYRSTIEPMLTIAQQQGFHSDWTYR